MTENTKKEKSEQPKSKTAPATKKSVRFKKNIELYTNEPIPEYNHGKALAYRARWVKDKENSLFVLVCNPALIPRINMAELYKSFDHPSLLKLEAHGSVFWPPANQERYIFVYHDHIGKKLSSVINSEARAEIKEEKLINEMLRPIAEGLYEFSQRESIHSAIRADNIFFSRGGGTQTLILGDCLSVPAFSTQPVLYSTIIKGMTQADARGPGSRAEDMYALGVTISLILRQQDPMEGLNDEDIIKYKITNGSYAAIAGKDRYKVQTLELLRGLLHDDESERWTVDELLLWLDGKRLTPKQAVKQKKAPRPITIGTQKYFSLAELAMHLGHNPSDTIKAVEDQEIEQWVKRALEDIDMLERIETAKIKSKQGGAASTDHQQILFANLSIALDSEAPIRYKDLKIMADGFGTSFARTLIEKGNIKPYIDLMNNGILSTWLAQQHNNNIDVSKHLSLFESCRKYLMQSRIGYGIERCAYALCPELHCLSETFQSHYIRTPEAYMDTLEKICKKGKAPTQFLDRHSIAFISISDSKLIDSLLFDLNSKAPHKRLLAEMKCLARIQKIATSKMFPHIAKAYMDKLEPALQRFHDKKSRKRIRKSLEIHAGKGNLIRMISVLDNPDLKKADLKKFLAAMREYNELSDEAYVLNRKLERPERFEHKKALKIAAVFSCVLSVLLILFITFVANNNTTTF